MRRYLLSLVILILVICFNAGFAEDEVITSWQQMDGKRIGTLTGSVGGPSIEGNLPHAEVFYFDAITDLLPALKSKKIDAICYDDSVFKYMQTDVPNLRILDGILLPSEYAPIFPKNKEGQTLADQYAEFVKNLWADGTIAEIDDIWFGGDESKWSVLDYKNLPDINGTLHMAADLSQVPFVMMFHNRIVGYDVDIAARFCEAYGYRLEIEPMTFSSIIPAVVSGKNDFAASNFTITPERAESVIFTEPVYRGGLVIAVLDEDGVSKVPSQSNFNADDIENNIRVPEYNEFSDLSGKTVSMLTGAPFEEMIRSKAPDVAMFSYFNTMPDIILALTSGKTDAALSNNAVAKLSINRNSGITLFPHSLRDGEFGFAFQKGDPDREKWQAAYDSISEETLQAIWEKWTGSDDSLKTVPAQDWPGLNGTVTAAVVDTVEPMSYVGENGQLIGLDVEIILLMAKELDVHVEFTGMDLSAILAAVQSGKAKLGGGSIIITDERKEAVDFVPSLPASFVLVVRSVPGQMDETPSVPETEKSGLTVFDLNGKRIGVQTGTSFAPVVESNLPDSKISYYNSIPDLIAALTSNKIDGFPIDEPVIRYIMEKNDKVSYIPEYLDPFDFAYVFRKDENGEKLRDQLSEFLMQLKADGTLEEIADIWFGADEDEKELPDYEDFPAPNGTLKLATEALNPPFTYISDKEIVGYEIDIAARFCEQYGYGLAIKDMAFDAILPSVQSGKYDFGCATITVTEERAENVHFSESDYSGGVVFAVRASDMQTVIASSPASAAKRSITLDDLNGKRIGVQTGQAFDQMIMNRLPNAEIIYMNSKADLINSLMTRKIDSYAVDEPVIKAQMYENERLDYIPEYLSEFEFGYVFNKDEKGKKLSDQFSEYIKQIRADGTMAEIESKWMNPDGSQWSIPDYKSFPAPNGTLTMATEALYQPFTFIYNNEVVGYDIDIAARFCEAYGYGLEIIDMSFDGILPSVKSEKADFGGAGITITAERAESVYFSEPNYSGGTVMAILKEDASANISDNALPAGKYQNLTELEGKKIGVQTGTNFDDMVKNSVPNAQILYFNTKADLVSALQSGKIDGFAIDEPVVQLEMQQNSSLTYIPDYLDIYDFACVFPDNETGDKLQVEFNEFLEQVKADGTLAAIEYKWVHGDESGWKLADYKAFPAPNGVIHLATNPEYEPFGFIYHNEIVGYEIDVIVHFCEAYGYGLELINMSFDSILPSIQAGKYEIGAAGLTITDERKENIDFSDSYFHGGTVMVVLKQEHQPASAAENTSVTTSYPAGEYASLADLSGKKIGVQMGTIFDQVSSEKIPNAEILYFNNFTDETTALREGKVDGVPTTEMVFSNFHQQNAEFTIVNEVLDTIPTAFVFPKTEKGELLRSQMNEFLSGLRTSGELDRLKVVWSGADESQKVMTDYANLPDINGRLKFVTEGDFPPFDYVRDGVTVGYDVEVAARFCAQYGYALDVDVMNFTALMPAIQAGKYDFAASGITITEERKEIVLFSDPDIEDGIVVMVRIMKEPGGISIMLKSISDSFERTFIRENRWKLFLEGVGNTLLITILSILFGTALGFLLFMLCRNGNPIANFITKICMWLVQGMPGVVLLMILFYVVFGSISISGIAVAVIGFTLTFGAAVFGLLKMGVGAVDSGQYEAAYALGYSNARTFFRIILPQAIPHVMDAYKGEIISLLKGTAIVGYIAVQDLTKMGDIVRSRTYEAFFPLIAVTVIYFLLEMLLGLCVRIIQSNIDPKRRSRKTILKGVNTHDQN